MIGWWYGDESTLVGAEGLQEAIRVVREPFFVVLENDHCIAARGGTGVIGEVEPRARALPIIAYVPAHPAECLGDPEFCADHRLRYPYVAGSMAHGISSVRMVEALAHAGMLSFFGAAGLPARQVEAAVNRLSETLGDKPYGFNLIHTPNEPDLEEAIANLYERRGIRLVEASAYLNLTLPLIRYRLHGIHCDPAGRIVTPNRVIAKVSRIEVATKFFSPPPDDVLEALVESGELTEEQARIARNVPVAQDLTVEADSGGHTDQMSAITVLPSVLALRDRMQDRHSFAQRLRVGAAGGIATPSAASAAFSMGAAYIMTGSINQACVESGTSNAVRELLAQIRQADVMMAPSASMFELGTKVQVVKRGTMFPMRAAKLYDLYCTHESIDDIPTSERAKIERSFLGASFDEIWSQTCTYFRERDASHQIGLAEQSAKHRMALIFRWYLSQASQWAIAGNPSRTMDYQIWCGPAMGAFNEWVKGTFLEGTSNRSVVTVALNLLYGACVIIRLNAMQGQGVPVLREYIPGPMVTSMIEGYLV